MNRPLPTPPPPAAPPGRAGRALLALALVGLCLGAARSGPVADPTRPPVAEAPPPSRPPAHRGAARPATAAAEAPAAPAAPQLQSVQLPRQGTPSALVDGRLVQLGDRLGDRTVVGIDAQGLQLRGPHGITERLDLLNGVTKHAAGTAPGAATGQAFRHATPLPPDPAASKATPQTAVAGRNAP